MNIILKRNPLRRSFEGVLNGDRLSVRMALFSYWKLQYRELRCNRFFLCRHVSNNYATRIRLHIKRKYAYFHPYQLTWTFPAESLVATNVSRVGQVKYELAGKRSDGHVLATRNEIYLKINGEFDEKHILPVLGELVFQWMDADDPNNIE